MLNFMYHLAFSRSGNHILSLKILNFPSPGGTPKWLPNGLKFGIYPPISPKSLIEFWALDT